MINRFLGLFKQSRIPISWLLLVRYRIKFVTALAGILFATVLIHSQLALRAALFDSSVRIFKDLNADVVVVNRLNVASTLFHSFDRSRLDQLRRYKDVTYVTPLRYQFARWRFPGFREGRLVIMIGFDPKLNVFNQLDIINQQQLLNIDGHVLYDELSRNEFGPIKREFADNGLVHLFINKKPAEVVGLVKMGTSFSYDASFLTSLSSFQLFSNSNSRDIEIGLVKLNSGVNPDTFLDSIRSDLSSDLRAYTLDQFIAFEQDYWDEAKPIGFVFGFNAALGFVVGMLILYQILYTDVSHHLSEFSTLLSLAFTYNQIKLIVFFESMYLAIIGYPIGLIVSSFLFVLISSATGLPVSLNLGRTISCFFVILFMSSMSALIAIRKLDEANPVEVFE